MAILATGYMRAEQTLMAETHYDCNGKAHWDVQLTPNEMKALNRGISPLFIRPGSLVQYVPPSLGVVFDFDGFDTPLKS